MDTGKPGGYWSQYIKLNASRRGHRKEHNALIVNSKSSLAKPKAPQKHYFCLVPML